MTTLTLLPPEGAPPAPAYPYDADTWAWCDAVTTRGHAPPGICEMCWDMGRSDCTLGLPYVSDDNGWSTYVITLCPACLACLVIQDGEVRTFARYPQPLFLRDRNGRFFESRREIEVMRMSDRTIKLWATTSDGQRLPDETTLPANATQAHVRQAYAEMVRRLDAADPLPPFVPTEPSPASSLRLVDGAKTTDGA